MKDIGQYANGTNLSVIAEFSGQNLEKLKNDITNSSMNNQTKKKLLLNVNLAIQTNNQTINLLISGNSSQAQAKMKYENTLLNTIKTQIATEKGKTINSSLADNLNQTVNLIQAGQSNGGLWILNNTPELNHTLTYNYYQNIESKVARLKSTISQLQAGGVPIDVRAVDQSDLQDNGDGTFTLKNSTNTTSNGTVEVKAVIPVIVIIIGAMAIEINCATMAAIDTEDEVNYFLETHPGEMVCGDCKYRMYELNLFAMTAGTIITWGVAVECMDSITLLRYGLGVIDYADWISQMNGAILGGAFHRVDALTSDGCENRQCIFYKKKKKDLSLSIQDPGTASVNHNNSIMVTVYNNRYGDVNSSFKVNLYENTGPVNDPQYTLISTQTISGLNGKSDITVPFNWVPTTKGYHQLKVVVDDDNIINETNEDNNEKVTGIFVDDFINYLTLYHVEKIPSSSDPSQYSEIDYYFKSDEPIYLNPSSRNPTFVYETSNPVYSDIGFQAWYPYGAMWQQYSETPDINGTWYSCYNSPYAVCSANVTSYRADHWASGSGHYQYFKVIMKTQPVWQSGIVKTNLINLGVIE